MDRRTFLATASATVATLAGCSDGGGGSGGRSIGDWWEGDRFALRPYNVDVSAEYVIDGETYELEDAQLAFIDLEVEILGAEILVAETQECYHGYDGLVFESTNGIEAPPGGTDDQETLIGWTDAASARDWFGGYWADPERGDVLDLAYWGVVHPDATNDEVDPIYRPMGAEAVVWRNEASSGGYDI